MKELLIIITCLPRTSSTVLSRSIGAHRNVYAPTLTDIMFHNWPQWVRRMIELLAPIAQLFLNKKWLPEIHKTGLREAEAFDIGIKNRFSKEGLLGYFYNLKTTEELIITEKHLEYLGEFYKQMQQEHPGKIILLKYFGGIFQSETKIQEYLPGSITIGLQRDVYQGIDSYVTLLHHATGISKEMLVSKVTPVFMKGSAILQERSSRYDFIYDSSYVSENLGNVTEEILHHCGLVPDESVERTLLNYQQEWHVKKLKRGISSPSL